MDWCNLQWPDVATIDVTQNETVYTQGWEPGVTDADPNNPDAGLMSGLDTAQLILILLPGPTGHQPLTMLTTEIMMNLWLILELVRDLLLALIITRAVGN